MELINELHWTLTASGYFSVPRNSICSRKWARPGILSGSLMCPTPTDIEAAERSVAGSLTSRTRIPLSSSNPRYSRSSPSDLMMFSYLEGEESELEGFKNYQEVL